MQRDVLENVSNALVVVEDESDTGSTGSGVLINLNQKHALILTCAHCFKEKAFVSLLYSDKKYEAVVIAKDPKKDLALLGIEHEDVQKWPKLDLASEEPELKEELCIAGNPDGHQGVAVEARYQATVRIKGTRNNMYLITLIGVNIGGLSGGALTNHCSEIVGILSSGPSDEEIPIHGMGYAVPLPVIKKFLKRIKKGGFTNEVAK